jgi:hypothetical protein
MLLPASSIQAPAVGVCMKLAWPGPGPAGQTTGKRREPRRQRRVCVIDGGKRASTQWREWMNNRSRTTNSIAACIRCYFYLRNDATTTQRQRIHHSRANVGKFQRKDRFWLDWILIGASLSLQSAHGQGPRLMMLGAAWLEHDAWQHAMQRKMWWSFRMWAAKLAILVRASFRYSIRGPITVEHFSYFVF